MKRFLIILIFFSLATTGCIVFDQAETIEPGDEIYNNPLTPPGGITSLSATVTSSPNLTNPVVIISFDSPADATTITFGSNITVGIDPVGATPLTWLTEGNGAGEYDAKPDVPVDNVSIITLDLRNCSFSAGDTIRVILAPNIAAYANTSILLSNPGTLDFTL